MFKFKDAGFMQTDSYNAANLENKEVCSIVQAWVQDACIQECVCVCMCMHKRMGLGAGGQVPPSSKANHLIWAIMMEIFSQTELA